MEFFSMFVSSLSLLDVAVAQTDIIRVQVSAATQPSFLQQAVHIDRRNKHLNVLGEVSRRFVVTPNVDTLLDAMTQADQAALTKLEDDTSNAMDTT